MFRAPLIRFVPTFAVALLLLVAPASRACEAFLQPYADECSLQDRYRQVRQELRQRHGVDVEQIAEYRAIRFIDRNSWERSKSKGSTDPSMVYSPAPTTWQIWERGANYADSLPELHGSALTTDAVRDIHRQAIDSKIMGRFAVMFKGAGPGVIRQHWWQLPPGFTASCEGGEINEDQAKVLMNFDLKDERGRPLIRAHLKPCREIRKPSHPPHSGPSGYLYPNSRFYAGWVSYLGSTQVPLQLKRLLKETGDDWDQLREGKLSSNTTPLALISDFQRRFIAIHPFGDGNGRTSRFVQDWMLRSLDLPFAPAGDLQHDMDASADSYRAHFKQAMMASEAFLEACLAGFDSGTPAAECQPIQLDKN